jgi:hypothetical protein
MSRRGYPDTYRDDMAEAQADQRPCARGEWCSARTVTAVDGERVVTPALTPRVYCDWCSEYIATCASELPAYWLRLAAAIGDPLQAEVQVHIPFGPQIILREDVDAHLRLMAVLLGGWAARVRSVARLAFPAAPHDSAGGILGNARTLATHTAVLLALEPGWMTRGSSFPPGRKGKPDLIADDIEEEYADTEIVRVGVDFADLPVLMSGEDAARDVQYLHYRSRSLLLETNPPPELLITPCRQCTHRALRRAWPESDRDLFSRCDQCGDEMTAEQYDTNARRWVAYHKAHTENLPVLGETPAA